tara:strand:- start:2075 stop:2440 length:366 start_codon:yes stop_codon:yes gene_type:complete
LENTEFLEKQKKTLNRPKKNVVIFNEDHVLTDSGRNKFGFPLVVESFHNLSNAHFIQLTTQKKPAPIWLAGGYVFMTVGTTPARSKVFKTPVFAGSHGGRFEFPLESRDDWDDDFKFWTQV